NKAAGEVLAAKRIPHRPGTAPALGLRAGSGRPHSTADPFANGETTMWFSSVHCWLKRASQSTPPGHREPGPSRLPRRPFPPGLEALEDRAVPAATFTVTNLNDAGPGSLRQAIADSNAIQTDADTIVFRPGLTGTIVLTTGQLAVTGPVTIIGPGSGRLTI